MFLAQKLLARVVAAASALTTLTFHGSNSVDGLASNGTPYNMAFPASTLADDLCIIFTNFGNDTGLVAQGSAAPTGFTEIYYPASPYGNSNSWSHYKLLTASDITTGTVNIPVSTDSNPTDILMVIIRPDTAITSVTANSVVSAGGTSNPAANVIDVAGSSPPGMLFGFFAQRTVQTLSGETYSLTQDSIVSVGASTSLYYNLYGSGGSLANCTIDMIDGGAQNYHGCYLEIT